MNRNIANLVKSGIILTFLVFIGLLVLALFPIGGLPRILTVESGSMEPAINRGSLVVIYNYDEYQVNDVISFNHLDSEGNTVLITHRITGKQNTDNNTLYQTKGDANPGNDLDLTDKSMVIGKVILAIPLLGFLISFAKTKLGVILLILIPCTILFWGEIQNIIKEIKKMRSQESSKPVILILLISLILLTSSTWASFSDYERIENNRIGSGEWDSDNNELFDKNCGVRLGNPHLEKCRKPQPTPDPPGNANGLENH